jgi:hypothetical protein
MPVLGHPWHFPSYPIFLQKATGEIFLRGLYFFAKHGKINLNFLEKQCNGIARAGTAFYGNKFENKE